jgi:putative transcriptional regulator
MNPKLFADLVESMTQVNEMARGERVPSREFHIDVNGTKEVRSNRGVDAAEVRRFMPRRRG